MATGGEGMSSSTHTDHSGEENSEQSTSQSQQTGDSAKLKCRKCREILLTKAVNYFRDITETGGGQGGQDEGNIFDVDDETKPDWISQQIEQGGWTKGRLSCPKCSTRVGGFDFVTGLSAQIYIVKSKVDIYSPTETVNVIQPSPRRVQMEARPDTSDGPSSEENSDDSVSSSTTESATDTSQGDESTDMDSAEISSGSSQNHTDHESSSDTEDYPGSSEDQHLSRRQLDKIKRRKKRRERRREKAKLKKKTQESKVEEKVRELLEAEPELDSLPDELICPVCLDLLFEPFQTEPCRHIFCEPCLRRLGQKNAMATRCPLCRSRIRFCKHLAATSREIREQHEAMYLRRKKFERSTPVFSYPLPWTPGWRNLLRGRPLGGNTIFVDENNQAEYMRTVLLQIPYYIPPVFLANFFNILVFGFLLGVVELLPTLLYALMGLRSSGPGAGQGINLTDALPDNPEDDIIPPSEGVDSEELNDASAVTEPPQIIQPDQPDIIPDAALQDNMNVEAEALDSTFYFILFFLSMMAAGAGQFLINHGQGRNRFGHRMADTMVVICLTCFPLLIIPTFLPYRAPQGTYLGTVLKRMVGYAIDNISFHTAVLVLLVSFIYHFEVIDDIMA